MEVGRRGPREGEAVCATLPENVGEDDGVLAGADCGGAGTQGRESDETDGELHGGGV